LSGPHRLAGSKCHENWTKFDEKTGFEGPHRSGGTFFTFPEAVQGVYRGFLAPSFSSFGSIFRQILAIFDEFSSDFELEVEKTRFPWPQVDFRGSPELETGSKKVNFGGRSE